ncbi:MAG TPA: hypothetical protein VFO73_14830 [Candidatus Limnocylindrales bacterium]|nr:hypothetical protein [Candidatus Limnocylindrales bacterium]
MGETRDQLTTSDSFERQLHALLDAELAAAERDFRPPLPRARRGRFASWTVVVVVAAVLVPVALVGTIIVGPSRSAGPTGSTPAVIGPSSSDVLSPTAASPATKWPGTVVATFESDADALAYDVVRSVVWIPVTQPVGRDYLYRYDPATKTSTRWELPELTYRGMFSQVIVDGSGAVWVYGDGYNLVRFEPETGALTSYAFPLEVPGTDWANGGTWISAIAADGDGTLVARNQVPFLVRLGPATTVTKTIDIPSSFAGATGLAISGDHLFMTEGAMNQNVARLSLAGVLEERFSSLADRLTPFGDGVIARHDLTEGSGAREILDDDGSVVDVVAPPFSFPMIETTVTNPLGVEVPTRIRVAPTSLVDNGQGTSWYLVQDEPVLREFVAP